MEERKINIEVKKINKNTKSIEWTDTIEIPYEKIEKISLEEKNRIKEQYHNKEEKINLDEKNDSLINTRVLELNNNPFYQPQMNTLEFNQENSTLIVNLSTNDNNQIGQNEKIKALEKLLEDKIITQEEFDEKKQIVLNQNK